MPSAKNLEKKIAEKDALVEKLKNAKSGVLVSYSGITVEQDTALRKSLRSAGVDYKVYKNTMTERACEEVNYGEMKEYLKGMTALAISTDDPVAPAKILKEYSEKVPSIVIKAGFIDGGVIAADKVLALANIPSKEVLICKIMMAMRSPLYKLAFVLQAVIDKANGTAEAPTAE